jgi:hypothetical protein
VTPHRIRYRRPETPWSLSQMTTPDAKEAEIQVDRLVALGYHVADVTALDEAPASVASPGIGRGALPSGAPRKTI